MNCMGRQRLVEMGPDVPPDQISLRKIKRHKGPDGKATSDIIGSQLLVDASTPAIITDRRGGRNRGGWYRS